MYNDRLILVILGVFILNIYVSGLLNVETTTSVRGFPVNYYPIDYNFFGIQSAVSGVAFNIAKALRTLGDNVLLNSMVGNDFSASYILDTVSKLGIETASIHPILTQTPASVVLYDSDGRRQIYCDLKNIQETPCDFQPEQLDGMDLLVACNINFNRPLLHLAKSAGKKIATDVHVLSDIHDSYNREFMECADILFLSDENIGDDYGFFLWELAHTYRPEVIVLGRGAKGAAMYLRETNQIAEMPAVSAGKVLNTVGAGDALFSAFVHFYAKGCNAWDALQCAQIFAAHKITVNGASEGFVTEKMIADWQG